MNHANMAELKLPIADGGLVTLQLKHLLDMVWLLTCTKLSVVEYSTFADNTPHGVGISDITHQQFAWVERPSGQV